MEAFFQTSSKLDEIDIEELLLRRYHNMDYILSMEIDEFIMFVNKANQLETDETLFKMWLQKFTLMSKDTYISFGEFYNLATGKNVDKRPTEELLVEIEDIESLFERR